MPALAMIKQECYYHNVQLSADDTDSCFNMYQAALELDEDNFWEGVDASSTKPDLKQALHEADLLHTPARRISNWVASRHFTEKRSTSAYPTSCLFAQEGGHDGQASVTSLYFPEASATDQPVHA